MSNLNHINSSGKKDSDISMDNLDKHLEECYTMLNMLEEQKEQFKHVKNIDKVGDMLIKANVNVDRITFENIPAFKNKCVIDNCNKQVLYELTYLDKKPIKKYICWFHLCNISSAANSY
jgi:hypothetical protein